MWKIFYSNEKNHYENFQSLEAWKIEIFNILEINIRKYFAEKVVVHFDNMMLFQQKRGIHQNLLESLSNAEKEMQNSAILFQPINMHIIKEENGYALITSGLDDKYIDTLVNYGFQLIENNANLGTNKEEKMRHIAWSTLVFDMELVNFATGWINYTPSLEERSRLQTEYILMNMDFKKVQKTLLEKILFKTGIHEQPQYEELYQKVLRVMPKIEGFLEQEWRTAVVQTKIHETIGQIKKSKSGI